MLKNIFKWKKTKKAPRKILSIEDDALLAKVLIEGLQLEGYEVVNVSNGMSALSETKRLKPDLILLDLVLPGIDGFEVLKQIKNDNETKKIPVFVVSNLGALADIKSVRALGAEQYFIKANSEMEEIFTAIKKRIK